MRIQPITPFRTYNLKQNRQEHKQNIQNSAYNPIAYNDVAFTARLFRSPEDFYSCPWNKSGMPETMKQYLNADYEDRQHMPPQQMLKLVFDDINETKNLEQVKRIFPDEPLFKNLTDVPNKKSKTGILAEIDLMKEENKSLFKNGKDNLGHYIIKKIYIEGKTLKEINEDFDKDKSVYYSGLSPIEYDTLRAFGIKFPNQSFWKSFTHNRTNFNYTYTPRKPIERSASNGKTVTAPAPRLRKRFEGVKDWEMDRLAEALNRGNGNIDETRKQLKKSSVRDEASLNFVAKYMSEINSVVLERLQVSPEMRAFFENPENISKSQKQKLDAYWQNSERRELRSIIMKDTIQWFFNAYGVDGQNDEFKELLDYAHNIKPNRIRQMEELQKAHDIKQAYYDEMFAELDAQEQTIELAAEKQPKDINELLNEVKKGYDVQEYRFNINNDEIVIVSNLREALRENIQNGTSFMPRAVSSKFIRYVESKNLPDSYILSKSLIDAGWELPVDDRLMTERLTDNITLNLYEYFTENYRPDCLAAQQAVCDVFALLSPEPSPKLLTRGLFDFIYIMKNLPENGQNLVKSKNDFVNAKYNEYRKPLSDSETRKISMKLFDLLRNYDPKNTVIDKQSQFAGLDAAIYSLSCYLRNQNPSDFKSKLIGYIKQYGGSARYLLDKNVPDNMKAAKLEQILLSYAYDNNIEFCRFITKDKQGVTYINMHNPELYNQLFGL